MSYNFIITYHNSDDEKLIIILMITIAIIKNRIVIPLDSIFGGGMYSQTKEICIVCTIKFILLRSEYSFSTYNSVPKMGSPSSWKWSQ